ncbi:hypothetical protein vseg_019863 [Gypsophila vaccaria]
MSMLKGKVGFVIPKNKFSGSLVPIFKKSNINNGASEETNKPQQRKTRWGADLTQDTSVKRGRALAYQTRVDQITEQLATTTYDDQNTNSAGGVPTDELATNHAKLEKVQNLELERREAIGEILKLNPGYKTPSDYEPVLRVATVPIPVKAHPEFNFLGLVYGSDGETQKKLEKETGTRIQVYGTVAETGKELEITPSDGSDVLRVCEEAYVQISADTYEKVDAAADLIEMLLNSVSVKPDLKATTSQSEDGQVTDPTTATAVNTSMASQQILQTGHIPFQPPPISWFPRGQSDSPSGNTPAPISGPSFARPSFGLGPPVPYIGSSPQSTTLIPPHLHSPAPLLQGMLSAYRIGQTGPPRNLDASTSPFPLVGHQLNIQGSPSVTTPQLAERPLLTTSSSPAWLASAPPSGLSYAPSQIRSSSALPFQSFTPQFQLNSPRPSQFSVPRSSTSPVPQPGMPSAGNAYGPSFTPLNNMGSTAPRPPLRGSNDFTFRPHLPQGPPSQSLPGQGMNFGSQRPSQTQLPPMSQMPLFRPSLQSNISQSDRHGFPRPPVGNRMGPSPVQFGTPNQNPHMGFRNHGPVPHFQNSAGPLPPRAGPTSHFQQSHNRPGGMFGGNQHSGPSGRPQFYDPFRPSSLPAAQSQGGNPNRARKQDSDPEYEDLMASVGVK